MKRKYSIVFLTLIFVLVLLAPFIRSWYTNTGIYMAHSSERQLNDVIASGDTAQMKLMCKDDKTYDFISKLPKGTECMNTSDVQGISREGESYLVTNLNGEKVELWVSPDTGSKINHKWKLKSVKLLD